MDIAEVNPQQLVPSVRNLGAGVMILAVFSSPSDNLTIFGGKIRSGSTDLCPQPPTPLSAVDNFDREINLMIGSFNFRVRSICTTRLSDPICLGPLTEISASAAASTSSVGSSGEENLPPIIIDSAESREDLVNLLNGISCDSDDDSSSDLLLQNSGIMDAIDFNFIDYIESTASDEYFTDLYDGVSYDSEAELSSGLPLQDEDPTIFDFKLDNNNPITWKVHPHPSVCTNHVHLTRHQICAVIENTLGAESEDFDSIGNPFVNPADLTRGTRRQTAPQAGNNASRAEGMRIDRVQV
jgi:hypothetical protein